MTSTNVFQMQYHQLIHVKQIEDPEWSVRNRIPTVL